MKHRTLLLVLLLSAALVNAFSFGQEPAPAAPTPATPPAEVPPAPAEPVEAAKPAETPPAREQEAAEKPVVENHPEKKIVDHPGLPDGCVRLEFREQQWLPALEWLAGKLKLNLDWRSLPEGTFNLHSEKTYTVAEAEDLLNMQLLARGFTMLKRGEVLRVEPLKEIDITLVPRVEPEALGELPKHSIARVSFPLDSMLAEEAATDLKPLLSPYGHMHPLIAANRLEVMDAVVNLREVARLLATTDSGQGKRQRVVEFKLTNRKASEIAPLVRQLMGLPPDGAASAAAQAQLDIEQTRFRAEAVKQLGGNAKEVLTDKKPEVFLVVNKEENSILVHAPPEKMDVARQAIESLDKSPPPVESAWEAINKVKTYSVAGYDPTAVTGLITALREIGNLDKETRIQHDAPNQRIIAVASSEDQLTISRLVEQFRGERRSAHVVPVDGVDLDYATSAVKLVLKQAERTTAAGDGKFEIEADPTHHRLLLWATQKEVEEVRQFLSQLGGEAESAAGGEAGRFQVVHLGGARFETVAEQFKEVWRDLIDAPVVIQAKPETPAPKSEEPPPGKTSQEKDTSVDSNPQEVQAKFASTAAAPPIPATPPTTDQAAQDKNGVRLMEGKNGEIVIVSRDPKLASSARKLLEQLTPSKEDVRIITLRYAQAESVKTHIDDAIRSARQLSSSRLDTSRPPSVQIDARLNRLLVQHCSDEQWDIMNQLVKVLDVEEGGSDLERKQVVYRLRYRRAADVAKALKDAYKDVMEPADKQVNPLTQRSMGFSRGIAAASRNPEYKGLLSIGVDEAANLLILSAPAYMLEDVVEIAKSMDTQSAGQSVAVVPFTRRTSSDMTPKDLKAAIESIRKAQKK